MLLTMRAVRLEAFGGAENLRLVDVPAPQLRSGHVRVRIAAAAINPIDVKIRQGLPVGPEMPAILGCDMAGTIEAVGDGVSGFAPGDTVFGCVGGVKGYQGTLAESIAADARLLARKPETLSMREAAALPLVGITAMQAFDRSALEPGEHVLIHGGTGGVGNVALQIAKARGARVATTVGDGEAAEIARALGAGEVILRHDEPVEAYVQRLTDGRGFDLVFDTVGGDNLPLSFAAARVGGRVATTNARTTQDLSAMHSKALSLHAIFMVLPMLSGVGLEAHGRIMTEIATLAAAGRLKPLIDEARFTLETAADAHRHLESGKARGKVVVDIV